MLPSTRQSRHVLGGMVVLFACLLSSLAARRIPAAQFREAPDYRQKGDLNARILVIEYSDFQCPACRAAEKPLRDLLALYGNNVRFVFKHFPLERAHPWARAAASASECAGRQGRFWEFHDRLYERQDEWSRAADALAASRWMEDYAKAEGLDAAAFRSCRADPAVSRLVDADAAEGRDRWVASTPTFFINNKRFAGARQLSARGPIWIDKQLKK